MNCSSRLAKSSGSFNTIDTLFGFMLGMGADYAHRKFLGVGSPIFRDPVLDVADVLEVSGVIIMLLYGVAGGAKAKFAIPAGIGAGFAQLYTKVLAPKFNLPRYLIQNDVT